MQIRVHPSQRPETSRSPHALFLVVVVGIRKASFTICKSTHAVGNLSDEAVERGSSEQQLRRVLILAYLPVRSGNQLFCMGGEILALALTAGRGRLPSPCA